uniref:Uncharacterized protein n=1 Tax=Papilio xuthus TaxID=66420 RepID=I4DP54_PAPXU|nr:unknown unsecreted protein [Papilio xuthus]
MYLSRFKAVKCILYYRSRPSSNTQLCGCQMEYTAKDIDKIIRKPYYFNEIKHKKYCPDYIFSQIKNINKP